MKLSTMDGRRELLLVMRYYVGAIGMQVVEQCLLQVAVALLAL